MSNLLLTSIDYSGYISLIKFLLFLVLFFAWLPLPAWVYNDARKVATKEIFWTAIVFGAGAAAAIIWLLLPVFIIGMLLFLLAAAGAALAYVVHRNSLVSDLERVLTPDHIKGLFTSQKKRIQELEDFIFITANNNEVPIPEPNTQDFFTFKAAHDMFADAMRRRANDVVLSPTQQNYNMIYYIDGAALKQPPVPRDRMEYFTHFVKSLADLDSHEKRKPQTGKFIIRKNKMNIEWQVKTSGSTAGEQIQLNRQTQADIEKLEDIGLDPDQLEQLNKLRDVKQGLFLVSGPRKNGVSTTLYALLRNHDPYLHNISTLERQITGKLVNITQNLFTLSDTGTTTYAKKLQSVMRTEPNIVGVGDCQDAETAKIACRAVRDGKLVYVNIEADNVIQALAKWIKLVGDKNLAVGTLLGISNQRLLRKLCEKCKQAYEPNKQLLKKFNVPADKAKVLYRAGEARYTGKGKAVTCENCQGTGFFGRFCIFEMIMLNSQLRKAVIQAKSLAEISTEFRRAKMLYLQEQALKKVIEGKTAINEMVRMLSSRNNSRQKTKPA